MKRQQMRGLVMALMLTTALPTVTAHAQVATSSASKPWMNTKLSADQRADLIVARMTPDEKLTLVFGYFGSNQQKPKFTPHAEARMGSAGYIPGIPRLGVPPQWETDAGVGVATQRESSDPYLERTSLPSGIATAATWNPDLAFKGGAMIGSEARASGFNVQLAGGANLARDPRNGRNFEYGGEDPLLAGVMVGAQIRGIQSNNIISTIKHWALNGQETNRMTVSSNIGDAAARQSDLLAFEFAIEKASPGAVMCAYNRINSIYACESDYLLNEVLKKDWGYTGYVMSDWGGTHSTAKAANAGLDQESAYTFDKQPFFGAPLKAALADGSVSQARLDDMARRITRSMFAHGLFDHPVVKGPIDFAAHAKVTQADAEEAIVLLKNDGGLLPIAKSARKIVVIGSHSDVGVLSGGGSSQVFPVGGMAVKGLGPKGFPGPIVYHPSSPLKALQARNPAARFAYDDGSDPAAAAKAAAGADLVIVFAHQWAAESQDYSLTLADDQDALIDAVAAANSKTAVVLETGGPVLMPWLPKVGAVVEAWYAGTNGGEAIARVLTGEVNPSGRLPITFPRSADQLPRPVIDGDHSKPELMVDANYDIEGAAVGYKWFDKKGHQPLFAFGHGLSYSTFGYSDLKTSAAGDTLTVSFKVTNTGKTAGKDVPQVYVGPKGAPLDGRSGWEAPRRLGGFKKVELAPGASTTVAVTVDPRLLATFDSKAKAWTIAAGAYEVSLGASSRDLRAKAEVTLAAKTLPVTYDGK
ncbi:beta-glucosidase [Caulobacter sp. Root1455]|uniref:beta-glucosidase n=1 Tax=Caulobacter sp. Root1455 TaxID=1736465 RepID=UPI0006F7840D|nr:glycoside hydrolase family 3 protein [Caulobacter sp. Root1455]KQZ02773.1 beta-glucosidase [Caulobacter sp. Root1455]